MTINRLARASHIPREIPGDIRRRTLFGALCGAVPWRLASLFSVRFILAADVPT